MRRFRAVASVSVIEGAGRATACTYGLNCGALPVARIQYLYPPGRYGRASKAVTFGACSGHAKRHERNAIA